MKFGSLPVIVFLFAATAELAHLQAQDDGPINAVWLEADLKGIALLEMKHQGVSITPDALNTVDTISNLPISLEWYRGCRVRSANAREILERFSTGKQQRFVD